MKKVVLLLLLLVASNSFSQTYKFDKVNTGIAGLLKAKGEIFISDTLITIQYYKVKKVKSSKQVYKVQKISKIDDYTQYLSVYEKGVVIPYEIRFTFRKSDIQKKYPYMFYADIKDTFKNEVTQMMYFIIRDK